VKPKLTPQHKQARKPNTTMNCVQWRAACSMR
jgi:hypothetical protein